MSEPEKGRAYIMCDIGLNFLLVPKNWILGCPFRICARGHFRVEMDIDVDMDRNIF